MAINSVTVCAHDDLLSYCKLILYFSQTLLERISFPLILLGVKVAFPQLHIFSDLQNWTNLEDFQVLLKYLTNKDS